MGTPAYMAPEQAAGRVNDVGFRTDVYGLGTILYEILTGRPPFDGASFPREVAEKVCHDAPLSPHECWKEVPDDLEAACLKALQKDPADRFDSAAELGGHVKDWQETERRRLEQHVPLLEAFYAALWRTYPDAFSEKTLKDVSHTRTKVPVVSCGGRRKRLLGARMPIFVRRKWLRSIDATTASLWRLVNPSRPSRSIKRRVLPVATYKS